MQGDFLDYFLLEELAGFAGGRMPSIKILKKADIDLVVAQFAAAAGRAKTAGFDGIEIYGGHGYLLSSFISPKTNSRTDDYGGPLANRLRFLLEVIAAVRAEVGPDFPVWCKLDSREIGKEGGIAPEDCVSAARLVEAAGVDAITVTAYHDTGQGKLHSASNIPHDPEANVPAAEEVNRAVRIPVIASGRIEPAAADTHIASGKYDFLAMGRKLLADPALPSKLASGETDRIRPCICCYTCVSAAYVRTPVRCAVNPETGFECERTPLAGGKRYAVIGGGPGGMEPACRLAEAGNEVALFERSKRLGGTLRFANLDFVRAATRAWMPLGQNVVIVGGELVGVELAEFLPERGRTVTVIEPGPRLGKGLTLVRRMRLLAELKEHRVALLGGVCKIAIEKGAVGFVDSAGTKQTVAVDHVIVAMGANGDTALAERLRDAGHIVETVGDCNGVGYIEGAIRGGANACQNLADPPGKS